MKKTILFTVFILTLINVQGQYTAIPDANFEQALIDQGIDSEAILNGQVLTADISGVTGLSVFDQNITDLTGIEDFTALETLGCSYNQLTALDVTQNINLTSLDCRNNQLAALDVTQNINLTELYCSANQLAALDLTQNIDLTVLQCHSNQLAALDLTQNTNLTTLYCHVNQLAALDLTQNINLTELHCTFNQLAALDLTQNINLTGLYCSHNQLAALDVTQNINLTDLRFAYNQLTTLDLTQNINLTDLRFNNNQVTALDVSQNINLTTLHCRYNQLAGNLILTGLNSLTSLNVTNNPGLVCIQVDNAADADAGLGQYTNWSKDGAASYSESCITYTAIPDANFEAALNALGYDDIPGDNQVPTTHISGIIDLDVSGQNIANLTGIEDFTALQTLMCNNNNLSASDLSNNRNLTLLDCSNNNLTSLNIANTNLQELRCNNNQLSGINIIDIGSLEILYCNDNQLTTLEVRDLSDLQVLHCFNNQLTGSLILNELFRLQDFNAVNNPNLTCIQAENPEEAEGQEGDYANWFKDPDTMYSDDCSEVQMMAKSTDILDINDIKDAIDEQSFVVSDIILYPNPVKDHLYLALPPGKELVAIILYNLQGEQVAKAKTTVISIRELAAGVYFASIQLSDGKNIAKKIIVSGD